MTRKDCVTETESISESNTGSSSDEIKVYAYALTEEGGEEPLFDQDTVFDQEIYKDETAVKEKQLEILGDTFDLTYIESARIACSDLRVQTYHVDAKNGQPWPDKYASITFNEKTGDIVSMNMLPHKNDCITEEDYIALFNTLIGQRIDASEYVLSVETRYSTHYEKWTKFGSVDGFHVCKDNEELANYTFVYRKTYKGFREEGYARLSVANEMMIFEVVPCNDDYSALVTDQTHSDFQKLVESFVSSVSSRYSIDPSHIPTGNLFRYNGELYASAWVYCTDDGEDCSTFKLIVSLEDNNLRRAIEYYSA